MGHHHAGHRRRRQLLEVAPTHRQRAVLQPLPLAGGHAGIGFHQHQFGAGGQLGPAGHQRLRQLARQLAFAWTYLHQGALRLEPGAPLEPEAAARLQPLGLAAPGAQRPAGWCSELHPGLEPWLAACGAALGHGRLLVIDYALEAWRYYAPSRSEGTLMAYREQRASGDPLLEPGAWDLTAHLCIDSLVAAAAASGWQLLGQRRQGEALLALGLAQRLHGLQHARGCNLPGNGSGRVDLADALARREALLRLVDPTALGDFHWLAFQRGEGVNESPVPSLFLQDPDPTEVAADAAAS